VGLTLKPGRIPMICCAYAESLGPVPEDYFWQVARRPIRFARTIESLELTDSHTYIDVGPSGSLATLLKYILPAGSPSRAASILSPFGQDLRNLDAVAGTMRYTSPTS
jgi:acyl transferase domain-containing protein